MPGCADVPKDRAPPSKRFGPPSSSISVSNEINAMTRGGGLLNEFGPSRKRRRSAILASTGALVQRPGSVLPALLPLGIPPREVLVLEKSTSPFDKALDMAFPPEVRHRVIFTTNIPKRTKSLRRWIIHHIGKLSARMQPSRLLLPLKLESRAPSRPLDIPLIMRPARCLWYPDTSLPRDLVYGAGLSGKSDRRIPLIPGLHPQRQAWGALNRTSKRGMRRSPNPYQMPIPTP